MAFALSPPLFLMGGIVRPILGTVLVAYGTFLLWRHARNGWRVEAVSEHRARLEEA